VTVYSNRYSNAVASPLPAPVRPVSLCDEGAIPPSSLPGARISSHTSSKTGHRERIAPMGSRSLSPSAVDAEQEVCSGRFVRRTGTGSWRLVSMLGDASPRSWAAAEVGLCRHRPVDPDDAGFQPCGDSVGAGDVAGLQAGGEPVDGAVGHLDRLVPAVERLLGDHRPEDLLLHDVGVVGLVGDDGGLVKEAGAVDPLTSDDEPAAFFGRRDAQAAHRRQARVRDPDRGTSGPRCRTCPAP
jgi:hypothetical protein